MATMMDHDCSDCPKSAPLLVPTQRNPAKLDICATIVGAAFGIEPYLRPVSDQEPHPYPSDFQFLQHNSCRF